MDKKRPESPADDIPQNDDPNQVVERYGIWYRSDRPRILGLIGWLLAGVGYVGFVFRGSQLPALFGMDMSFLIRDYKAPEYTRAQFTAIVLFLLTGIVLSLLSIAAGMGLLRMKEWGRRCVVYFAIGGIVHTIAQAAFQIASFESMLDFQQTTTQQFDRTAEGNPQFFVLLMTAFIQVVVLLLLLLTITRPFIKEAIARSEQLDAGARGDWESTNPPG